MVHWGNEPLNKIIFSMLDQKALKEPFFLYVHYNFRRDFKCNDRVRDLMQRLNIMITKYYLNMHIIKIFAIIMLTI